MAQARDAGFTRPLVYHNVQAGRTRPIEHGIFRLREFPETAFADLFVAWLRTGPDSVISHESALSVYGLSDVLPGEIHVTVRRTASRRRRGMRLHTKRLTKDEITRRQGLPVTTVPRTLADVIVSGLDEELVHQATQQAVARGLATREQLLTYAAQRGGRAARVIRRALGEGTAP